MKLGIIVGSTRQNRKTLRQAKWVANVAKQIDNVEVDLIDLVDFQMPFFDEPIPPRFNNDRKLDNTTTKWLEALEKQDAYIFVTAEYNHSIPGVLKNALDYETTEIQRKPFAVVSHGSSGGTRAAMHLKEILSECKAAPIPNAIAMSGLSVLIDEDGKLSTESKANPRGPQSSLINLISELYWYSNGLEKARSIS